MQQILVYSDSLSWGIIPTTRQRLPLDQRWPGVMEIILKAAGHDLRIIEDCLNGRRTVWDDPFKPGRNGLDGLQQRIEIHSPLRMVMLMLGNNDFQSMHTNNAWHSAQGTATLVHAIRTAPIEPGMPVPDILIISPPPLRRCQGPMSAKFEGGELKCQGLAALLQAVADQLACDFFDAGSVCTTSALDGVHLDADQHLVLGQALASRINHILGSQGA
jgi:lysophospholipase L1-like esterase